MAAERTTIGHESWLALTVGGPVLAAAAAAGRRAQVVTTSSELGRALRMGRPRVVMIASPPAGQADLELVAATRDRRPAMRAVLVNPPEASDDRIEALQLGFDEALPDTIGPVELASRIRLLGRHRPAGGGHVIDVGDDLEVDLDAHALRRGDVDIHLRPKEYQLLALLATHPGQAFSRRQLLDRVWGPGHPTDPRTVDVHVRWLRSKLEADAEHPVHLITVRGTGYRMDPQR